MSEEPKPRKPSSVRHTRAIQRDRNKSRLQEPPPEEIERLLDQLVSPIVYSQSSSYQAMGLRQRILNLPVMVAFVLSLIWRQVGSVTEAVRELNKRGILWARPTIVSQQAVSERLRVFPPELFRKVLMDLLPQMNERWKGRQRPLNAVIGRALEQFSGVWVLDGSTLDVLLRKVGLLREGEGAVLAGRMGCLLNAASLLPTEVWFEEDSQTHDQNFWERAVARLPQGGLLLFDLGFVNYTWFDTLTKDVRFFVTRCKTNAVYEVDQVLHASAHLHDRLVWLGSPQKRCENRMRLVEVEYKGRWFRYLTNVLDPQFLSAADVAAIYQQRWRVEDAFNTAKRLLGLAYFWVGSINGIQVQIWATWLFYSLLVDLADRIADALDRPFEDISMEMVFKGLYHFVQEKKLGRASDPVDFLAQEAKFYGVLKHRNHPKFPLTPIPDAYGLNNNVKGIGIRN
jgi:hypothetical protein